MRIPPDVRGALRSLRHSPAFVALAAVTLGLGVGAAGAMFALVRQVVLEPLPIRDESAVVVTWGNHRTRGFEHFPYSYAAWEQITNGANGVEALAGTDAWGPAERLVEDRDGLMPTRWSRVLGDFFGVLDVRPAAGRSLDITDDVSGGVRVAVVSWSLWLRRWNGAPTVLGATLMVNGESHSVVGVLPREFDFPRGTDVWVPMRTEYAAGTTELPRMELDLIARLAPGTSGDRFGSEITRVLGDDAALADAYGDVTPVLRPFRDVMLGDMRQVVLLLFAGSVLLMLVACVNVSNLVLMRAGDRAAGWSVRRALGGSRAQLTVGPVVEAAVITGLAAVVAGFVTAGSLRAVLPLAPAGLPVLETVRPDGATWLLLAAVLALCCALLAGIPVWRGRGPLDPGGLLRSGLRAGPRRRRTRTAVVAGQAALALWAVAVAALLVRSLANLRALDTGFDQAGLYVVQIDHRYDMFSVPPDWPDRLAAATESLMRERGITAATPVIVPPLVVNGGYDFVPTVEGTVSPDRSLPYVNFETVMPEYFETLRLPIVRGRPTSDADVAGSQTVVVVNEAAAHALWPGEDPIGKRIEMPWPGYADIMWTVVGVAADARYRALLDVRPSVYVPLRQMTLFAARWIAVRTAAPVDLMSVVRDAFATADPGVRVVGVTSVPERLSTPLARPRFALTILGAIAAIILLLAAVGAYGVMAAGVRGRTRELGVRMACGATPMNVGRLVIAEGIVMAALGTTIGIVAALATGRFVQTLLFGVRAHDPIVLIAAAAIVLATAVAACVSPALRAARTDPLSVLRSDGWS
jgi:predicted permease